MSDALTILVNLSAFAVIITSMLVTGLNLTFELAVIPLHVGPLRNVRVVPLANEGD